MPTNDKDTIYIDIDDEITTIIEKVRDSDSKIVALVLPKRATMLQSIVNMKLLKRSAENEKKSLVLITSEAGLLPLAGNVGLYVAKTLQSKPEIPAIGTNLDDNDEVAEEASLPDESEGAEEVTAATAGSRPVGELAKKSSTPAAAAAADEAIETLQLDDEPADAAEAGASAAKSKKSKKDKKDKKLAVPNFDRFRLLLIAGVVALILLIVGIIVAAKVLPKANIVITTDTSSINSSLTFTADTAATALDTSKLVVPAKAEQVKKTQNQQVPTTGQQNNGTKATGSITLTAQKCSGSGNPENVAAGTGVSTSGVTYITQETATFHITGFNAPCASYSSDAIDITAQSGGAKYNVNSATFSVAGRSDASGTGSASGGTDNIIQIVSQSDIDNATQKIAAIDTSTIKQQVENQLKKDGLFPLEATYNAGAPATTSSSNVGDQATTVTVTQEITYTMYGVKQADLKTIVDNDVKGKIDPSKQGILSEGLDKATFHVNNTTATAAQIALATTATAGPDLQVDSLKTQIAGKKAGQVSDMIKSDPGVTDVKVHLSPFWVTSVPSKASKVTIIFQKAN